MIENNYIVISHIVQSKLKPFGENKGLFVLRFNTELGI